MADYNEVEVQPIAGFIGGEVEACLKLKQQVVAEPPGAEATRELAIIAKTLDALKPPFVKEQSTQGTELHIDLAAHWPLMISIALFQDDNVAQAQFKVGQGKNKHKMNMVLQEDGKFAVVRDDQKNPLAGRQYKMQWVSPDIERKWLDLRKYFRESCKLQPGNAKGTQLGMLRTLLDNMSGLSFQLRRQIELYCYSTNAWMKFQAADCKGVVWKVVDHEPVYEPTQPVYEPTPWADIDCDDEENSFPIELLTGARQNVKFGNHKSTRADWRLQQNLNLFEQALDKSSKELHPPVIVKNTSYDFAVEQCTDRRRSRSCPRPQSR